MTRRGRLDILIGGMPAGLDVYDDGLLVVSGSKGARAGMAFGALGALIGQSAARKGLAKRRDELDQLAPTTGAAASAVDNTELIPTGDITAVRIKKAVIGPGRSLRVERSAGRPARLAFHSKKVPTAQVEGLLRPLLGERLIVADGA